MDSQMSLPGGSSPHTRGARSVRRSTSQSGRIIPAYAGSTASGTRSNQSIADHPRIRGEHLNERAARQRRRGSSPHTRGAQAGYPLAAGDARIIPAYAGSTRPSQEFAVEIQDHPRIRGEHTLHPRWVTDLAGSSPHTRGAHAALDVEGLAARIIPAYAGSTVLTSSGGASPRDHPRIRGEHVTMSRYLVAQGGSSPHTRGARRRNRRPDRGCRIIPAYAGSTGAPVGRAGSVGDHPRIRGEHVHDYLLVVGCTGSSPHTRGAQRYAQSTYSLDRIIPAYAGSTWGVGGVVRARRDHPRIRGEHVTQRGNFVLSSGSSPHTRGARPRPVGRRRRARIIPAYAGSTTTRTRP